MHTRQIIVSESIDVQKVRVTPIDALAFDVASRVACHGSHAHTITTAIVRISGSVRTDRQYMMNK